MNKTVLSGLLPILWFVLILSSVAVAQQIPAGTVLPVMLDSTIDVRHDRPGKMVTAKIMQDVPLPDGATIPEGAHISGRMVSATPATAGSPSQLGIRFDQILVKGRSIPVSTHLRALASMNDVFEAKLPTNSIDDYGTSPSDWNTIQIGGAGVFRGSGEVVGYGEVVGKTTDYGAVTAKLVAAPDHGCKGNGQRAQALWLFSPWACGVYGYADLKIAQNGTARPSGVIEFQSRRDVRINGGSGLLLRVDSPVANGQ